MPIADYGKRARIAETALFENPDIPEHTKQMLQRFLIAYDVSDARKVIFLQKMKPLLVEFDPIESALTERDQMNGFFANIRRNYSPATYATYINVHQRFLTWFNDGEKPISLKDIHSYRGAKTRRNLKPEDMITWEDGLRLCDATFSTQVKAAVQTQLDCGFRPSEFIDLVYRDVDVHKGLVVFHVRAGKTGGRTVVAHRCVPALLKWMENHPSKKPSDPLWVSEKNLRPRNGLLKIDPYAYDALAQRVRKTGRKVGLEKPLDFYNFRHSSCVLDKLDNLPVDLAAERHGHSVKHFTETYGRLSIKDVVRRFQSHYGTAEAKPAKMMEHQTCPTCKALNNETQDWCSACGTPLNAKSALETAQKQGLLNPDTGHELEKMKAELASSRKREDAFRKEQMLLLRQVQDIRTALAGNSNPSG